VGTPVHDRPSTTDPANAAASNAANTAPGQTPHFHRYLAIVLLLPLVAFLLTFPLAASQSYLRISRRQLWHATHYRFLQAAQQNCDVVIAGDSSGMIGVDPHVIQALTGWTTCNLGLPYVGTALAGTRVLDDFLTHNRPPRFIVFHLSNNHLRRPALDEDNGIVDGWLMVDEHFPFTEKLRIFASHPLNTMRFVSAVWKGLLTTKPILRPDWSGATEREDMARQQAEHGWMPQPGTAAEVVCGWQDRDIHADRGYLDTLIQRYSRGPTHAVIWTNPIRDCDAHISDYRRNAQQLGLRPTEVYDRNLFTDAFHLNTDGAARNAEQLTTYLLSLSNR
jgi:hypothetical protein